MMHNRRWCVQQVESAEELVEQLKSHDWCGCCGFELHGYLWLNDSTSPDAVQEYAVVRCPADSGGEYRQVESITVGWCNREELLKYVLEIQGERQSSTDSAGQVEVTKSAAELRESLGIVGAHPGFIVEPVVETPSEHGRCSHCA